MLNPGTKVWYAAGTVEALGVVETAYPTSVVVKTTGYFQPDGTLYVPPVATSHVIENVQIHMWTKPN